MPLLSWFRGDTHSVEVTVSSRSSTGFRTPINVTGSTSVLSVKGNGAGAGVVLSKVGTVEDGPNGKIRFAFAPADTVGMTPGTYAFDVEVTLESEEVYTVVKDSLELIEDVTTP